MATASKLARALDFKAESFVFEKFFCCVNYLPVQGIASDVFNCSKRSAMEQTLGFTTHMRYFSSSGETTEQIPVLCKYFKGCLPIIMNSY